MFLTTIIYLVVKLGRQNCDYQRIIEMHTENRIGNACGRVQNKRNIKILRAKLLDGTLSEQHLEWSIILVVMLVIIDATL